MKVEYDEEKRRRKVKAIEKIIKDAETTAKKDGIDFEDGNYVFDKNRVIFVVNIKKSTRNLNEIEQMADLESSVIREVVVTPFVICEASLVGGNTHLVNLATNKKLPLNKISAFTRKDMYRAYDHGACTSFNTYEERYLALNEEQPHLCSEVMSTSVEYYKRISSLRIFKEQSYTFGGFEEIISRIVPENNHAWKEMMERPTNKKNLLEIAHYAEGRIVKHAKDVQEEEDYKKLSVVKSHIKSKLLDNDAPKP